MVQVKAYQAGNLQQLAQDYERIEQAIQFLEGNFHRQPELSEVARSANLSEYHFQRLFSRWVGISPKRFLQFLTKEYAKKLLEDSRDILEVAYGSGLSGTGRLHDLFIACEAMTPGQYKCRGQGMQIEYGFHPSPFGRCLLAVTERGICGLRFVQGGDEAALLADLQKRWENATLKHVPERTLPLARRIFSFDPDSEPGPLYLYVRGTNFQVKVWEALLKIPFGKVVSYEDIARHLGMPRAGRAVGNAVGRNPIPFLIPCHRVIRKMGEFGNYGEGPSRKKVILGWEAAQQVLESEERSA